MSMERFSYLLDQGQLVVDVPLRPFVVDPFPLFQPVDPFLKRPECETVERPDRREDGDQQSADGNCRPQGRPPSRTALPRRRRRGTVAATSETIRRLLNRADFLHGGQIRRRHYKKKSDTALPTPQRNRCGVLKIIVQRLWKVIFFKIFGKLVAN